MSSLSSKITQRKFCSGKHKCPLCGKVHKCDGVPYGHDENNKGNGMCHGGWEQFCNDCQFNRFDEINKMLLGGRDLK